MNPHEGPRVTTLELDSVFFDAIAEVMARYPEDVFPAEGTSDDARFGTFARHICREVIYVAATLQADRDRRGSDPVTEG